MLSRKYKTIVAGILTAGSLFSPLLCGMTCREGLRVRPEAVKTVTPAAELTGEFVGSVVVDCVLTHVVSKIDFGGWADEVDRRTWVWVGEEALRSIGGRLWK